MVLHVQWSIHKQHRAIVEEAYGVAVLRLVHVVSGHEYSHSLLGKAVYYVPELPPCDWVHAPCRLIQKQHLRFMNDGASQCQPLLPASGKAPRYELFLSYKVSHFQDLPLSLSKLIICHSIDACIKIQILLDRDIIVEAELLRHVASMLSYLCIFLHYVISKDIAAA